MATVQASGSIRASLANPFAVRARARTSVKGGKTAVVTEGTAHLAKRLKRQPLLRRRIATKLRAALTSGDPKKVALAKGTIASLAASSAVQKIRLMPHLIASLKQKADAGDAKAAGALQAVAVAETADLKAGALALALAARAGDKEAQTKIAITIKLALAQPQNVRASVAARLVVDAMKVAPSAAAAAEASYDDADDYEDGELVDDDSEDYDAQDDTTDLTDAGEPGDDSFDELDVTAEVEVAP